MVTGDGWTWVDPVLTVNDGANITITRQVDNGRRIQVAENANATKIFSCIFGILKKFLYFCRCKF